MIQEHSFTYIVYDSKGNIIESTIKNTQTTALSEVLEQFALHLKSCGFVFDGHLEINCLEEESDEKL